MPIAYSIIPCAPIRVCTCRLCMTMSCCSRGMHAHSTPQTQGFLMSSKSAPAQHFISSLVFHSGRTAPSGWPLISNKYFELSSATFPLTLVIVCLIVTVKMNGCCLMLHLLAGAWVGGGLHWPCRMFKATESMWPWFGSCQHLQLLLHSTWPVLLPS